MQLMRLATLVAIFSAAGPLWAQNKSNDFGEETDNGKGPKLGNAQVIDPKLVAADGRCVFGATVEVEDGDGQSATWQIVGEDEADIKQGRISVSSPIARALIGKEAGESVDVQTPGGVKTYEILDVRYE